MSMSNSFLHLRYNLLYSLSIIIIFYKNEVVMLLGTWTLSYSLVVS